MGLATDRESVKSIDMNSIDTCRISYCSPVKDIAMGVLCRPLFILNNQLNN